MPDLFQYPVIVISSNLIPIGRKHVQHRSTQKELRIRVMDSNPNVGIGFILIAVRCSRIVRGYSDKFRAVDPVLAHSKCDSEAQSPLFIVVYLQPVGIITM